MTLTFILTSLINSIRCLLLPTFRSLAALLSEKYTVFTFSHRNAYVTKFDVGVNQVKVNTGSSSINYDGLESPMLHTKFPENGSTSSGEEDFLRFLPYMGMAAILVM